MLKCSACPNCKSAIVVKQKVPFIWFTPRIECPFCFKNLKLVRGVEKYFPVILFSMFGYLLTGLSDLSIYGLAGATILLVVFGFYPIRLIEISMSEIEVSGG